MLALNRLDFGGTRADALAGLALRFARARKVAGVHNHRDYDSGPRHWPEHQHVQRPRCRAASAVAFSELRTPCEGGYLRSKIRGFLRQFFVSRFLRLAESSKSRPAVPFCVRRKKLQSCWRF